MDHWKSCLSCLFWQWIIGNLVYPVYFSDGLSEIVSILCQWIIGNLVHPVYFSNGSSEILYVLAMDHRKSYLSYPFGQWIIGNRGFQKVFAVSWIGYAVAMWEWAPPGIQMRPMGSIWPTWHGHNESWILDKGS